MIWTARLAGDWWFPLTCSRGRGTSACRGRRPGSVAADTPRSAPAAPGHPGWCGRRAAPASRGTAGRRCPRGSPRSRCAGTGADSRRRCGASRRRAAGSGSAAGWAGTADTPPGAHPAAAPGWRRSGTAGWPGPLPRHPRLGEEQHLLLLLLLLQRDLTLRCLNPKDIWQSCRFDKLIKDFFLKW